MTPPDLPHFALLLARLGLDRLTRIVDVGANPINRPAYADLRDMGGCQTIGFEPGPDSFIALQQSLGPNEVCFPHAVGDGSEIELHLVTGGTLTSVFKPDLAAVTYLGKPNWADVEGQLKLKTVALDKMEGMPTFDLMKIDSQGGELTVFQGAEALMATCMAVIVEQRFFPIYQGEPMIGGLDVELRRQGFFIHRILSTHSVFVPNSRAKRLNRPQLRAQLVDGAIVYLRDMTKLAAHPTEQIKHLCLLAAAVFGSHSLVLHLLDELVRRQAVAADLPDSYCDSLPQSLLRAKKTKRTHLPEGKKNA